ncbi:phage tail tip lysozyme [Streptococcus cameli]
MDSKQIPKGNRYVKEAGNELGRSYLKEQSSRVARKETKQNLYESRAHLRDASKEYSLSKQKLSELDGKDKKAVQKAKEDVQKAKRKLDEAKSNFLKHKQAQRYVLKNTGYGVSNQLKQTARIQMARQAQNLASEADDFAPAIETISRYQDAQIARHRMARATHYGKETTRFFGQKGAKFVQNSSAFIKSQSQQLALKRKRKRQHFSRQQHASQSYQTIKKSSQTALQAVSKNPFALYAISLLVLLLIIASFFGPFVDVQSEYDLNQTYLYFTKKDREKSNDVVDYWTNWEDTSHYIQYRYDDLRDIYKFSVDGTISDTTLGEIFLKNIWQGLNGNHTDLKTIKDLYTKKDSEFELKKEELETYKEILESISETGKFPTLNELEHPFYPSDSPESDTPVKISERFGYVSKKDISNKSTLKVEANQKLYAPMSGTVTVKEGNVTIATKEAKFVFYDVTGIRVKSKDKVDSGTEIGKTSRSTGQSISYQKKLTFVPKSSFSNLLPKEVDEWVYVNPGYYFKFVEYLQKTTIQSSLGIEADKAQRVAFIYNYFKKNIPGMTIPGLAAALGNWEIENDINPKRAEGDYLPPPVGATPTSWDDDNWLNIGGPTIYGGAYPNIIHRGIGMGQFTDTMDGSIRATLLRNYAKSKGKKWYDMELQLEFMLQGDNPAYQAYLKNTLTRKDLDVNGLTNYFLIYWEGNPGNKLQARQEAARKWEAYLSGTLTGSSTGTSGTTLPAEYSGKLPHGLPKDQSILQGRGYPGNAYAIGQCTWYVYNRMYEIGKPIYPYLGNAGEWVTSGRARGYTITSEPRVGSAVVFLPGVANAHPQYGHVGFCEYVNEDGSILMSDMNGAGGWHGLGWTVLRPQPGVYFMTPN